MERILTWLGDEWMQWDRGTAVRVWYKPRLDGGGSFAADWFVDFFRRRYPDRAFRRAFEWCAGPGFIGFSLLDAGVCEQLVLADINPDAVECVRRTVAMNEHLAGNVSCYLSDNLRAIPPGERFDLVVSNPPYAVNGNPRFHHDRRTQDPCWRIHAEFFGQIKSYLAPGALLCISEFCPLEALPEGDIRPPGAEQWDRRERAPIEDLLPLIRRGGLKLTEVVHATGKGPLVRTTPRGRPIKVDYVDWFWVLVMEVEQRATRRQDALEVTATLQPQEAP